MINRDELERRARVINKRGLMMVYPAAVLELVGMVRELIKLVPETYGEARGQRESFDRSKSSLKYRALLAKLEGKDD